MDRTTFRAGPRRRAFRDATSEDRRGQFMAAVDLTVAEFLGNAKDRGGGSAASTVRRGLNREGWGRLGRSLADFELMLENSFGYVIRHHRVEHRTWLEHRASYIVPRPKALRRELQGLAGRIAGETCRWNRRRLEERKGLLERELRLAEPLYAEAEVDGEPAAGS